MKVVLLQDGKKLGKRGDVVEVADSYGRNVLIRRGLGAEGTKANLNTAEQRRESKEFKSKVAADEAVIMASQLKKVKAVIKVQSGEDGRVFGSLGTPAGHQRSTYFRSCGIKISCSCRGFFSRRK